MASSVVFAIALVWFLLSGGVNGGWSLTKEEDEELDRQLRIINKPATVTIKNEAGDVIDCIDFDKQPACDHFSSENHLIQCDEQGRNISYPNGSNDGQMPSLSTSKVSLKTARCPPGTVAIRRTTKEDLVRLKSFSKSGGEYIAVANPLDYTNPPGFHCALLLSDKGSYRGAQAWLEVHSISGVELNQYSGTSIMLVSGADGPRDKFNVIVVGWHVIYGSKIGLVNNSIQVHPALYRDNLARFTIFWTTDGYQHTNCFNLGCSGFIPKSSKYSPGIALNEGTFPLSIFKDKETGNWCISTLEDKTEELIGCLENSMFSSLAGNAEFIEWGGTVMSSLNRKSPPMGNGQFPLRGARVSLIQAIDKDNQLQDPRGRLVADRPSCYDTAWFKKREEFGWSFYYGGPGGC